MNKDKIFKDINEELNSILNELNKDKDKSLMSDIKSRLLKAIRISKSHNISTKSKSDLLGNPSDILTSIQLQIENKNIEKIIDDDEIVSWDNLIEESSFSNVFLSGIASGNESIVKKCCEQAKRNDISLNTIKLVKYKKDDLDLESIHPQKNMFQDVQQELKTESSFKQCSDYLKPIQGDNYKEYSYQKSCINQVLEKKQISLCVGSSINPLVASLLYSSNPNISSIILDLYKDINLVEMKELVTMKLIENERFSRMLKTSSIGTSSSDRIHWQDCSTGIYDIVDAVSDLDDQDGYGATMLHWAVNSGDYRLVDKLVKSGASLDVKNNDGLTPFEFAQQLDDGYKKIKDNPYNERSQMRRICIEKVVASLEKSIFSNEIHIKDTKEEEEKQKNNFKI